MNLKNVEIYTDGSYNKQHNHGAWASIIFIEGEKTVLKGEEINTTHNRMEIVSVIESIKFCDEKQLKSQLIVYTDSQYVFRIPERKEKLKQNQFITNKGNLIQNADLVQTLIRQIESHSIKFIKVKAHQKTNIDYSIYNSQADKLSRKMVRQNTRKEEH